MSWPSVSPTQYLGGLVPPFTFILQKMDKTQEILNRVDRYLRLMQFHYESAERLSRMEVLKDYYISKNQTASEEVFCSNIEVPEQLSSNLKLPLRVRGVFLTAGKPKARFYSAEEIEKSVRNPVNASFPLMLDHRDKEASAIIGKVTRIEYDSDIEGIRWWGHINDETFARNVMDGVITQVSATIFAGQLIPDEKWGLIAKDLTFKELSLVMDGAEPDNYLEHY